MDISERQKSLTCSGAGQRESIFFNIFSAAAIASAMHASKAGQDLYSNCASLRAARIEAAMSRTRFRPSVISGF
jgi:hypothetical protein